MLFAAGGTGAGVAGGAATGASAGAIFGPWGMAIGAVGGAVLGGIGASKQNKKIKQAAIANQQNINVQELQLHAQTQQQNVASSQQFRLGHAQNAQNLFGENNISGNSLNAAMASNLYNQIHNTEINNVNMDNQLRAMELQKQQIATSASNQSTPIGMAAVSGAVQGMGVVSQLGQAYAGFQQLGVNQARSAAQQDLMGKMTELNQVGPLAPEQMAQMTSYQDQLSALNAGINPDLLRGQNADVVLQPFRQQREMYQLQFNVQQNELAQSGFRYGFNQRYSQQYLYNPLAHMGPGPNNMFSNFLVDPFIVGVREYVK